MVDERWTRRVGVAAFLLAVALYFTSYRALEDAARGHKAIVPIAALLGMSALLALAAVRAPGVARPALVVWACAAAVSAWTVLGLRDGTTDYVRAYCAYGAVSAAQLAGCEDAVVANDVDRKDTAAGRFARMGEPVCRSDAGPFCESNAAARNADSMR